MNRIVTKIQPLVDKYGSLSHRVWLLDQLKSLAFRRDLFVISDETLVQVQAVLTGFRELYGVDSSATRWAQFNLGFSHLWRTELDEAEENMQAALQGANRSGDAISTATIMTYLAVAARKRCNVEETQHRASAAMAAASALNMNIYVAMCKANLAWVAFRQQDMEQAEALGAAAQTTWDAIQPTLYPWRWAASWPLMGVALNRRQLADAIACVQQMFSAGQQPQPPHIKTVLEAALQAWNQGDAEHTRTLLEQAADLATVNGYI